MTYVSMFSCGYIKEMDPDVKFCCFLSVRLVYVRSVSRYLISPLSVSSCKFLLFYGF